MVRFSKTQLRESRKGTPGIGSFFKIASPPRAPQTTGAMVPLQVNSPEKAVPRSSSESRKRGRADESGEVDFFDDTSMLVEGSDEGTVEAPLTWQPTPFSATDFVAKNISGRPGEVAFRSTSVGGKGDTVIVIPTSRYEAALDLYSRRHEFPATTDGVEDPPVPGVVRGGKKGVPQFMRTDKSTAVKALMQAKEPYGSPAHKFIFLASALEKESPAVQEKMVDRLPEARDPQFSHLFVDDSNKPSPLWVVDMVHDTGGGEDTDYSGRLSDAKTRAYHDGRVFGGAQSAGSGRRGATRIVEVGSAEDERVRTEAADTTHVQSTMALPLWDVVAIMGRKGSVLTGPQNREGMAKTCAHQDCTTSASHGVKGSKKAEFCAVHATRGMVNIHSKKCKHRGCTTTPSFGVEGSTLAKFCTRHASQGMVNVRSKNCAHEGCTTTPTYGAEGSKKAEFCARHSAPGMVAVRSRNCAQEGCTTIPCYGVGGSKKPEFCARHAAKGMVDVYKICRHEACTTAPSFGVEGSKKAMFCAKHRAEGMVDIRSKRCAHEGCKTAPSYGVEGTKKTEFCAGHAKEGMVDVRRKKRCTHESCMKRPTYGVEGSKKAIFCGEHAAEGMVDVYKKACNQEGCKTRPSYGVEGSNRADFCVRHAAKGMVDVRSRRCAHEGCTTRSSYCVEGSRKAEFCSRHVKVGMVNIFSKKCAHEGCTIGPSYGVEGSKKTEFCAQHAPDGMVNVVGRRCAHKGCAKRPSHGVPGSSKAELCALHAQDGMVGLSLGSRASRGNIDRPPRGAESVDSRKGTAADTSVVAVEGGGSAGGDTTPCVVEDGEQGDCPGSSSSGKRRATLGRSIVASKRARPATASTPLAPGPDDAAAGERVLDEEGESTGPDSEVKVESNGS